MSNRSLIHLVIGSTMIGLGVGMIVGGRMKREGL